MDGDFSKENIEKWKSELVQASEKMDELIFAKEDIEFIKFRIGIFRNNFMYKWNLIKDENYK